MIKRIRLIIISSISIAILVLLTILAIVINSPYYNGFEAGLNYLSPDLSENRTTLRSGVYLNKKSVIKIVFEKKYNQLSYDQEQFYSFINDIEIQIWNDNEYYTFNSSTVTIPKFDTDFVELKIGELLGSGNYIISIDSNFGVNAAYHIGLGIGRDRRFTPLGNNNRNFY